MSNDAFRSYEPKNQHLATIAMTACGIFVLGILSIAYVRTEITTYWYKNEFNFFQNYCKPNENPDFKYFKIIQYDKSKGEARIQCIYSDGNKNMQYTLNFVNTWSVASSVSLVQGGTLPWPLYF